MPKKEENNNKQSSNKNNNNKKGNNNKKPNFKDYKSMSLWIVLILGFILAYQFMATGFNQKQDLSYSAFKKMIKNGEINQVQFSEKDLYFKGTNGIDYHTHLPYRDPDLVKELDAVGIEVVSKKPSQILGIVLSWLPFLVFIGIWLFMMRSMRGGGSKVFSFGKNKAKLFQGGKTQVTFKDVAGVTEAKEELEEIIDFLKSPTKFQRLGGRIPRGVLLLGKPGTGKTLLAKACAGEAKVPFFSISGSDFVEMFVGVGASRVRDMFANAKKTAPCIIFIDEIDAVGRHRGAGHGGGNDEREQTLNQLLVEMDGFDFHDTVIVIAATNRPDVLDPALLRPGRFDRQVTVDLPDIKGREKILKVHTRKLPLSESVKLTVVARSTPGFSGADLANLANEAALIAARKGKNKLFMSDFEEARDKVTMGKAKRNKVISEEDKRMTSYHEIGHVLCSIFQENSDPVHKVSIIPRGFAAGATQYLQTDKMHYSKSYIKSKLVDLIGGRIAEKIQFNDITTGASNDIKRMTDLARSMVCEWGMSEKLGPIQINNAGESVFLGKQLSRNEEHSDSTNALIDSEIRRYIKEASDKAENLLRDNKEIMVILSEKLLEKETLEIDEIYNLIFENLKDEKLIKLVRDQYEKSKKLKISFDDDENSEENSEENSKENSKKKSKINEKKEEKIKIEEKK